MFRTCALHQVSLQQKVFAASAVEARVLLLEEVFAAEPAPKRRNSLTVPGLSGSNKCVRRNGKCMGKLKKPLRIAVYQRLNRDALRARSQHVLESVFIRAGLQYRGVAGQALVACDGVSLHEFKGMPNVRWAIDIRY